MRGAGEPRAGSSAIACCRMSCGISRTGDGGRIVSSSRESRAGSSSTVACWMNCGISRTGGGGSLSGCRVCCAFCSCRCHRK